MIFIARLNRELAAIELDALGWVVQGDEEPIARFYLFFMLDSSKLVAWVKADNLFANHFDVAIGECCIEEVRVLLGCHIGDHDLKGGCKFHFVELTKEEFALGYFDPLRRVNACFVGGHGSV